MRSLLPACFVALVSGTFVSCTTEAEEPGSEALAVSLTVKSPEDGATYEWGETIDLEVQVKEGGKVVDARSVVWTLGDRTERGASSFIEAERLDAGSVDVSVDVAYGGNQYNQRLSIKIDDGGGGGEDTGKDTGKDTGNNGGSGTYSGTMASHIWYDGEYGRFDGDCPGTVDFTIDDAGALSGTGWCRLDGEYDFYYTLEGVQGRGDITGTLIAESDGTEYRTPFTGTGKDGETQQAEWDKTFQTGGDSLRIAGSFVADPV
jgi:hypothetical protein